MFLPLGDNVDKRTFPVVGAILIALNCLFYVYSTRLFYDSVKPAAIQITEDGDEEVVQLSAPAYEKFMHRWGLVPRELARGHIFSIFTSMFMHADFFHIFGNMIMFYALMSSLESLMGWQKFLLAYFGWGVAAALAHVAANCGSTIPTIGASGAISGVIGAYFIAFGAFSKIKVLVWLGPRPMKFNVPATVFVIFWVFQQLLGLSEAVESGVTGVAWWAHAGGFVAGAATMHVLKPQLADRMVLDHNGLLQIKAESELKTPAAAVAAAPAPECEAPPTQCPYCQADLAGAHQIHERLLRCPGESCSRLIFLTKPLPAPQTKSVPEPELQTTAAGSGE